MTRWTRGTGFLALAALLTGCSRLEPVQGPAPVPGTQMAYDINDVGRVALGGAMGPEIARVEGHLLGVEDGVYLVSVTGINFLRGGFQSWSGEMVRLRPEYIGNRYERKVSTGRSIAMGSLAVGGFAAFILGRSLAVGGNDGDDGNNGNKPPDQLTRRIRP